MKKYGSDIHLSISYFTLLISDISIDFSHFNILIYYIFCCGHWCSSLWKVYDFDIVLWGEDGENNCHILSPVSLPVVPPSVHQRFLSRTQTAYMSWLNQEADMPESAKSTYQR